MQRQAGRLGLRLEQGPPHAVHGHPVERRVDGGDEPDHGHVRPLPQHMQRPGRVLAAAPAQKRSHAGHASWRLTRGQRAANARFLHHGDGRSHGERRSHRRDDAAHSGRSRRSADRQQGGRRLEGAGLGRAGGGGVDARLGAGDPGRRRRRDGRWLRRAAPGRPLRRRRSPGRDAARGLAAVARRDRRAQRCHELRAGARGRSADACGQRRPERQPALRSLRQGRQAPGGAGAPRQWRLGRSPRRRFPGAYLGGDKHRRRSSQCRELSPAHAPRWSRTRRPAWTGNRSC